MNPGMTLHSNRPKQVLDLASSADRQQGHTQLKVGVALLLGILAIVVESSAGMGHAQTAKWVRVALGPHVSAGAVEALNAFLRKCGHLTGFGVLGLIGERAAQTILKRRTAHQAHVHQTWRTVCAGVAFACVAGICDEVHQSFLPTRHAAASDVLLDTLGAAVLLAGAAYIRSKARVERSRPAVRLIPMPASAM